MNKKYEKIEVINRKYGVPTVRMALTYLFSKGTEYVSQIDLEEARKEIEEDERIRKEEREKSGALGVSIMTVDYQLELIKCAQELSAISLWDLLAYVKDEVAIYGCKDASKVYDLVKVLIDNEVDNLSEDGKLVMEEIYEYINEEREDD
jgi:hypothetical protein